MLTIFSSLWHFSIYQMFFGIKAWAHLKRAVHSDTCLCISPLPVATAPSSGQCWGQVERRGTGWWSVRKSSSYFGKTNTKMGDRLHSIITCGLISFVRLFAPIRETENAPHRSQQLREWEQSLPFSSKPATLPGPDGWSAGSTPLPASPTPGSSAKLKRKGMAAWVITECCQKGLRKWTINFGVKTDTRGAQ